MPSERFDICWDSGDIDPVQQKYFVNRMAKFLHVLAYLHGILLITILVYLVTRFCRRLWLSTFQLVLLTTIITIEVFCIVGMSSYGLQSYSPEKNGCEMTQRLLGGLMVNFVFQVGMLLAAKYYYVINSISNFAKSGVLPRHCDE